MVTFIYGLFDPTNDELRYIGKTQCLLPRLKGHLDEAKGGAHNHKCHWIRSILAQGLLPRMLLLDTCDGNGVMEECEHIASAKANGTRLVNQTDGGEGTPGLRHTTEARAKMSAARKGHKKSEAWRRAISEAHKGVPKSPAAVAKVAAKMRGRKLTPEHIEKVASQLRGKRRSPDVIERGAAKRRDRKSPPAEAERLRGYNANRVFTAEHRTAISLAGKGRLVSSETKAKLSTLKRARDGDEQLRRAHLDEFISRRKELRVGRKAVAEQAGMFAQAINDYEWGKRLPTLAVLRRLHDAIEVLRLKRSPTLRSFLLPPSSIVCTCNRACLGSF